MQDVALLADPVTNCIETEYLNNFPTISLPTLIKMDQNMKTCNTFYDLL